MAFLVKSTAIVHDPKTFVTFSGPATRTRSQFLQISKAAAINTAM